MSRVEYKIDEIEEAVEFFKRRNFDKIDLDTIEMMILRWKGNGAIE